MRNTLFVMTHQGSSWESLKNLLEMNPRIHVFNTGIQYKHYEDLEKLWDNSHRNDNAAAWWVDIISENENFTCKELGKYCDFIYFLTKAEFALPRIKYKPINAAAYYRFRLRGLVQWWTRTGGPWIDCADFIDPTSFQETIKSFLPVLAFDYNHERQMEPEPSEFNFSDSFPPSLKKECSDAFVRYNGIVQGRSVPVDGDSHLLSMQASARSL